MRVQVQALLGDPGDQLIEIVAREPLAAIACRLHLGLVAVVPDEVDGSRLGIEARGVLVLDAIAIRELHLFCSRLTRPESGPVVDTPSKNLSATVTFVTGPLLRVG